MSELYTEMIFKFYEALRDKGGWIIPDDLMDYTRRLEMFVENLPRECSAVNKLAEIRSGR